MERINLYLALYALLMTAAAVTFLVLYVTKSTNANPTVTLTSRLSVEIDEMSDEDLDELDDLMEEFDE